MRIKVLPLLLLAFACSLFAGFLPKSFAANEWDIKVFSQIPVQHGGRIKPLDTLARNTLLVLSKKQSAQLPNGQELPAAIWLAEVFMRPEVANTYKVFRIDNPEVLGLFGWKEADGKYFSYKELLPQFPAINNQANNVNPESQLRSAFERQITHLSESLTLYEQLLTTIHPAGNLNQLDQEYAHWLAVINQGVVSMRNLQEGKPVDTEAMQEFVQLADSFVALAGQNSIGIFPSNEKLEDGTTPWMNLGQLLLGAAFTRELNPIILDYATLIQAWRAEDSVQFNQAASSIYEKLAQGSLSFRMQLETLFNTIKPFYVSIQVYVLCLILVLFGWVFKKNVLLRVAFGLLLIAFIVHTLGIGMRMYLQGRPPVTNLYSSAIFVGWGAVLLALVIEKIYKNGLGAAVAAFIGFTTLIIAHNLAMSGDTLEMMRAVLDSNFWLSTHVIVITLGYAAMFLAGILAMFGILKNSFSRSDNKVFTKTLVKMVYGIIAFATLFSFVGTMLGGIWADQSWGRFWGWDPKENGALLIVLWCIIMLHAKWGKLVKEKGFLLMAIFGNIVTSWSWFGTNMLGVGLHSYGFIDSAFLALAIFMLSQLLIMLLGLWRFRGE
ncbi:MAG: hypothetical protein COZ46_00255 [Verrucomicrobia bacterium CG_4_10_14_3_um_filter_43_23]|nr:MAG: hypothetical protein AUJ82_04685 [Verrucomicrobia bacterium CG1_02_43_26]PIP59011.1 MAG: hypothetical protein COX01_05525 [Verrucomicrobia bacterium CG22_combo_CG10-13_8_21_14_all_43_17]PIX59108.1 MAG: hypothetical protein COZ46_00255 [Verrucomicrobia bacterium CG_4_10_14_3_um_filter_43_23]PIY61370.1 MAG: hypothetical protein COY94_05855 [Verrucomicrobia bacterium CG_4_10_14_0_8_um_filter_43_34]PJA44152.1 MAG: hypothetical protein CO175_04570 [Verrucomicrobia bacterium CG_4_9_14_3_um_fi